MTIDIALHGAGGRMGFEIARVILGDKQTRLAACVDHPEHPSQGADMGTLACGQAAGVRLCSAFDPAVLATSVMIDFSAPEATVGLVAAVPDGCPGVVVGSTGFSDAQLAKLAEAGRRIPLLVSPNMSLGVNLLFYLTDVVARRIGAQFDIEIIEAHHHHKKDSPSGTARRIAEVAAEAVGLRYDSDVRHGRNGLVGERPRDEIGMHAVRGGDIVGDHTVLFAGEGERIELRHMMHNRSPLAIGAVTAAKWLNGRKPGLYSMKDMLGL